MELSPDLLQQLRAIASAEGLLHLGAVRLDHPGFGPSHAELDEHLDHGRHGEMEFLARTREVRKDPALMLPGARSVLVAAVPYRGEPGPIARYALAADYHCVLYRRLHALAEHVHAHLPGVKTLVCVDTKPILERATAALAGLGFVGKHGCLIVPGLGSMVLLGGLLCTAELSGPDAVPDPAAARWDACGQCTRCLDACPTDAFVGPGRLDSRRCISYLTIEHRGPIEPRLADAMGERIAGCDVCQEVCPYNAGREREARVPAAAWIEPPPAERSAPDLVELSNIRSGRYRAFVKHTALRRIPRRALRRNALLALGNRAGPLTEPERQAAELARGDDDPQIRAAAQRLLDRRGGAGA